MGKAEWSDWIAHDGQRVPVREGTLCEVETKGGDVMTDTSHGPLAEGHCSLWIWASLPEPFWFMAITRYRIRQSAAMAGLKALIADPYAPPTVISPEGPLRQPERVTG